jgi:hypothetical protein
MSPGMVAPTLTALNKREAIDIDMGSRSRNVVSRLPGMRLGTRWRRRLPGVRLEPTMVTIRRGRLKALAKTLVHWHMRGWVKAEP